MIGKKGKDTVSIPIHQVETPRFRYGDKQQGGTGQGDGEPGDPIGGKEDQNGESGKGKAGDNEGQHVLEVDVTFDELIEILAEELELPKIEKKGAENIHEKKDRYSGIRRVGPKSLRHFKRTHKEAMKRMISSGLYDPQNPMIIPQPRDERYRSWKTTFEPVTNAVVIYMMDVSGSMGDEQKEIVRLESFWIDLWLQKQYDGIETVFIIHDASAKEVDRETFFRTRESGGTMISSAYKLCWKIMQERYPPSEWNIYPFHFSDGDNWSKDDSHATIQLLKEHLLPNVNVFSYGQVTSPYGSGQFLAELEQAFHGDDRLTLSKIETKDEIMDSIKTFLGKGK